MSTHDEPVTNRIKIPQKAQPVRHLRPMTPQRMGVVPSGEPMLQRSEYGVHDSRVQSAHDVGDLHWFDLVGEHPGSKPGQRSNWWMVALSARPLSHGFGRVI